MTRRPAVGRVAMSSVLIGAVAFSGVGCAGGVPASGSTDSAPYPSAAISVLAPGDVGGGWDSAARAMEGALTDGGLTTENVDVYNIPGAGGTIGLAEFISDHEGDSHQYMWTAATMIGAVFLNDSPVSLQQTTPIARTHTAWRGIFVDADSEYETFEDLMDAFVEDPRGFAWAGGSAGGGDHLLLGSLAELAGVDPKDLNFIATGGGGELNTAVLSGAVSAGSAQVEEIAGQAEAGEVRLLAVTSPERILDVPTLTELGYADVKSPATWLGVVAPSGISDDEREAMIALVESMVETEEWQSSLEANNWSEYVLVGDEFSDFLAQEKKDTEDLLVSLGLMGSDG